MPFSWLDLILAAIMLLSGLLAMLRGLTREVLSITSWAAAAFATLFLFPEYRAQAQEYLDPPLLADAVLIGGIFLVVLIIVSLITVRISDSVLDSRIGALDRSLGFLFGLARGLLIVVILYLFSTWLMSEDSLPKWVKDARSLPILKETGAAIVSLLPEDPTSAIPGINKERDATPPQSPPQTPPQSPPQTPPPNPDQRSNVDDGKRFAVIPKPFHGMSTQSR